MKPQKSIRLAIYLLGLLFVSNTVYAEHPSQRQEPNLTKNIDQPVQFNPFKSPYNEGETIDIISRIAGNEEKVFGLSSFKLKAKDDLWIKILSAANEAGVLETVKNSAVVKKTNEIRSALRNTDGYCRPHINNIPAPVATLNMKSKMQARSIVNIECSILYRLSVVSG